MSTAPTTAAPAYLIFDIETVPDGELLRRVKYPGEGLSVEAAVERARAEAREKSGGKSDFVPASFVYPVAVCVARVAADFSLQAITCLDAPQFRPQQIVRDLWAGLERYPATLVSYNGRGFDLPVLELAAFRFGIAVRGHFDEKQGRRQRYGSRHLDLADWLSNYGACPVAGGLNLLSKLLGKPGKMSITGHDVWEMFRSGKIKQINDYCMFDVLDTYFVFLRTRVLAGALDLRREQALVAQAKSWIHEQLSAHGHLQQYLDNWGDWEPWV
jgi:predicted PolB exonuclease-like 3'-5' exonuclease